jgi:hypothetical protein
MPYTVKRIIKVKKVLFLAGEVPFLVEERTALLFRRYEEY